MESINNLLLNVLNIHKQHTSKRNAGASKNKFNVFSILKVEYKETKHSAFLAELLNPRGSHEMGDSFLKIFYQKLGINNAKNISKSIVSREFVTAYGNIDIYIQAEKPEDSIIIENKIYADDQEGQLARYHTYDSSAHLVYLTLDGHFASEKSLNFKHGKGECQLTENDYKRINYVDFIIDWIEQCHALVSCNTYVKETLGQYIELLKEITKNTLTQEEKMQQAKEVVKNKESVEAFLLLIQNSAEIYKELSILVWNEMQRVANKLGVPARIFPNNSLLSNEYTHVLFDFGCAYYPVIGFEKKNFSDIWFGITGKDDSKKDVSPQKNETIRKLFEDTFDKPLPAAGPIVHKWWNEYRNLSVGKFSSIYDGSFANDLEVLLLKLKEVIDAV